MKRFLLLINLSLFSVASFAQMSGNYNYSIAVRGYSLVQMPKLLDEPNSYHFNNAPFNGVMVKFNDNQISYRLNGTFYNKSRKFYNNCETCEEANGKVLDYSFKIGFEKSFNYAHIQPYFSIDMGYRYNRFMGNIENRNELKAMAKAAASLERLKVEASKSGFIASPVIGVKINLIEQLSFFAEGNLEFFYFYEKQERIAYDVENTKSINKYTKSEFLLNPISVGIQIHVGSNN